MTVPFLAPHSIAPTNNLYKFVSLFGLTLLVLSIVLGAMRINQHNTLIGKAQISRAIAAETLKQNASEAQSAIKKLDEIGAELDALKAQINRLGTQPSGASLLATQTSALMNTVSEAIPRIKNGWESTRETQIDQIRVSTELAVDQTLMDVNVKDLWTLTVVASIISIVGFLGWYFRLQQPQDRLLQLQVEFRTKRLRARNLRTS